MIRNIFFPLSERKMVNVKYEEEKRKEKRKNERITEKWEKSTEHQRAL